MLRAQRRDPAKAQAKCAFATNGGAYPLANRQLRSPLILRYRMQRDKPYTANDAARFCQQSLVYVLAIEFAVGLIGFQHLREHGSNQLVGFRSPERAEFLGLGCSDGFIVAPVNVDVVPLEELAKRGICEIENIAAAHVEHFLEIALLNVRQVNSCYGLHKHLRLCKANFARHELREMEVASLGEDVRFRSVNGFQYPRRQRRCPFIELLKDGNSTMENPTFNKRLW